MRKIEKFIVMLVISTLTLCGCTNDKGNEAYDSMKKEMENKKSMNICVISATETDEELMSYSVGASGIVIGKDQYGYYALTAAHVVDKEKTKFLVRTVYDPDKEEYRKEHNLRITSQEYYDALAEAQVVYTDQKEDLAIVHFNSEEELSVAEISQENPSKNDLIIAVGTYADKMEYFYESTGRIKNDELVPFVTNDKFGESQVIRHSAFTAEGFSGAGVFNSEMQLVGMNIGGSTNIFGGFKYSVMIPCEQIQNCIVESNINVR